MRVINLLTNTLLASSAPRRAFLKTGAAAAVSFSLGGLPAAFADDSAMPKTGGSVVFTGEETMSQKAHGTSATPVQESLRWNVNRGTADRITSFNRHYAEYAGYWKQETSFLKEVSRDKPTVYYDSVTGKPLFVAPIGRSMDDFLAESNVHGWPSFRDEEVVWENMRVLKSSGEAVSADGTHLGHNLRARAPREFERMRCFRAMRILSLLRNPLVLEHSPQCSRADTSELLPSPAAPSPAAPSPATAQPIARATATASTWSRSRETRLLRRWSCRPAERTRGRSHEQMLL